MISIIRKHLGIKIIKRAILKMLFKDLQEIKDLMNEIEAQAKIEELDLFKDNDTWIGSF